MNGVHDMGGMEGLGPIAPEADEPVFHHPWEARALALTLAVGYLGKWNIDNSRHARELIPGPLYLQSSYYEKWLLGLDEQMLQAGLLTRAELASGQPDPAAPKSNLPLTAGRVGETLAKGSPANRPLTAAPAFAPGQAVRARNMHPHGHTRLPRYVRGHVGTIQRDHGGYVFPDTNAHFQGEQPRRLYSVRFAARELWGPEAAARDAVYLDLWEPYLEPA